MRWIKEHKLISVLIAIIAISFVVLLSSILSSVAANPVGGFVKGVMVKIEKPVAGIFGNVSESVAGMFSYQELQEENDRLRLENEELKQQLQKTSLSANELKELKSLSKALNYKGISGKDDLVSADIAEMNGNQWMNIFTIDQGTDSGIQEGCIVICGDGLVGRVSQCGDNWSKVVSIIDESVKISFKLSGNLKIIGIVEGSTDGTLSGFMLDSESNVEEGDRIETSGMGIYPAGIEIGKITKVKYDSDAQLKRVDIKPSVEFKSLQKVSVIL